MKKSLMCIIIMLGLLVSCSATSTPKEEVYDFKMFNSEKYKSIIIDNEYASSKEGVSAYLSQTAENINSDFAPVLSLNYFDFHTNMYYSREKNENSKVFKPSDGYNVYYYYDLIERFYPGVIDNNGNYEIRFFKHTREEIGGEHLFPFFYGVSFVESNGICALLLDEGFLDILYYINKTSNFPYDVYINDIPNDMITKYVQCNLLLIPKDNRFSRKCIKNMLELKEYNDYVKVDFDAYM